MEKISALMDGELDARLGDQQFAHLKNDSGARACWDTYHLIGDALRGERVVSGNPSGRLERFSALLAQEPTVLAPHRRPAKPITAYAWPVAASLSAVALVGWMAVNNPLAPQPEIARVTPVLPAPVTESAPVQLANVPSEGRMNDY